MLQHTCIIRTVSEIFGLRGLTNRHDESARSFADLFDRADQPRSADLLCYAGTPKKSPERFLDVIERHGPPKETAKSSSRSDLNNHATDQPIIRRTHPRSNDGWTASFSLLRPLRPDLIEQTDILGKRVIRDPRDIFSDTLTHRSFSRNAQG
jgi:hypothetical protein